jgi:hypothetical protein
MVKLTDDQIEFIRAEIAANGVTIEDLQLNLLDHICCILENEMSEGDDFKLFFADVLPRFFTQHLREIQEETELLLTFKHFYAMKKTMYVTGVAAAILMILFSLMKIFHLPGAKAALVLEVIIFSFLFLPLLIVLKFKDDVRLTDKLVLSGGFLLGMMAAIGILFKMMHWPYATALMLTGISGFTFIYVPVYFFTRFRRPESKLNTGINSVLMLITGGLLFSLFNLRGPAQLDDSNNATYAVLLRESQLQTDTMQSMMRSKKQHLLTQLTELRNWKSALLAKKTQLKVDQSNLENEQKAFQMISKEEGFVQALTAQEFAKLKAILSTLEKLEQRTKDSNSHPLKWEELSLKDGVLQLMVLQNYYQHTIERMQ